MGSLFFAREGVPTASATKTALQQFGSTTTATDITVPPGMNAIDSLVGWVATDESSATGTLSALFRTEGNGVPNGPEAWAVGAIGMNSATGNPATSIPSFYDNLNIPVKPGGALSLFGEFVATGNTNCTIGVQVGFTDKGTVGGGFTASSSTIVTRTYEGSTTTTQADNTLTAQGSVTTAPATVPIVSTTGLDIFLVGVKAYAASLASTVGRSVHTLRIGGNGVKDGEQDYIFGGQGGQLATHAILQPAFPLDLGMSTPTGIAHSVRCTQGAPLTVQAANSRTNIGTSRVVATLLFRTSP